MSDTPSHRGMFAVKYLALLVEDFSYLSPVNEDEREAYWKLADRIEKLLSIGGQYGNAINALQQLDGDIDWGEDWMCEVCGHEQGQPFIDDTDPGSDSATSLEGEKPEPATDDSETAQAAEAVTGRIHEVAERLVEASKKRLASDPELTAKEQRCGFLVGVLTAQPGLTAGQLADEADKSRKLHPEGPWGTLAHIGSVSSAVSLVLRAYEGDIFRETAHGRWKLTEKGFEYGRQELDRVD